MASNPCRPLQHLQGVHMSAGGETSVLFGYTFLKVVWTACINDLWGLWKVLLSCKWLIQEEQCMTQDMPE